MGALIVLKNNSDVAEFCNDYFSGAQSKDLVAKFDDAKIEAIKSASQSAMIPCDKETAKKNAEILFGSLPQNKVPNVDIYTRAIVSKFMEYPGFIVSASVGDLVDELDWLPSRATVKKALDRNMARAETMLRLLDQFGSIRANVNIQKLEADAHAKRMAEVEKFRANGGADKLRELKEKVSSIALANQQQREKSNGK